MHLKEYRARSLLTQGYMARSLMITQARYSRIETGITTPGMKLVNRIVALTNGAVGYKDLRPDIYEAVMGGKS